MKKIVGIILCVALLITGLTSIAEGGGWICSSCGEENAADDSFCGNCGSSRSAWVCPSCGRTNTKNFCTGCGQSRPEDEASTSGNSGKTGNPETLLQKGVEAYDRGDYASALFYLAPAAEAGNARAQYLLGNMYEGGYGVEQDYETAMEYYQLAADQGDAKALTGLGIMYYGGDGVEQSFEKAMEYWQQAADQGNAYAQNNLASMYANGKGVEQDNQKALEYYRLAADSGLEYAREQYEKLQKKIEDAADGPSNMSVEELYEKGHAANENGDYETGVKYLKLAADQGYAEAQFDLGFAYRGGKGVSQSEEKAMEYFLKAADQGHATALYVIGHMYEEGDGAEQDYAKALEFYQRAEELGFEFPDGFLDQLREKLSTPKPTATPTPKPAAQWDIPDLLANVSIKLTVGQVGKANENNTNTEHYYYSYHHNDGDVTEDDLRPFFRVLEEYGFTQVNYELADYISVNGTANENYYFRYDGPSQAAAINVSDKLRSTCTYHLYVLIRHLYNEGRSVVALYCSPDLSYEGDYVLNRDSADNTGGSSDTGANSNAGDYYDSTGSQWPTFTSSDCPYCGGKGTKDCQTCGGTGYVEQRVTTPQYGGIGNGGGTSYERKTCPNAFCHGGQVDCMFCGGTGKQ